MEWGMGKCFGVESGYVIWKATMTVLFVGFESGIDGGIERLSD